MQTPKGIYRGSLNLADSRDPAYRFFPNAEDNPYLQTAEGLEEVKTYLWFARFPWVTYREDNGFHIVEYRDIQFFGPFRGNNPPFTFRVFLDGQGRIVSSGLLVP